MNYLYLKENYGYKENKIYDGLFYSKELNNEHTRTCEVIEHITSEHLFKIKLNKTSLLEPSIIVEITIKGNLVKFILNITLDVLYDLVKESDGLSGSLDFNNSVFFYHENKFYSLYKNKDFLLSLKDKSLKELEKFNKNTVITKSKLLPFQTYLNSKGETVHVLGVGFVGKTDMTSKIIVLKSQNDKITFNEDELIDLMINGNYDLLEKSDLVEKLNCFFSGENQTKTGLENFLNKYRKLLLTNYIENGSDFVLSNSNLKFSDIINKFKSNYPLVSYSHLSDYDRHSVLSQKFKEKEDVLELELITASECLDFATNTLELFALYVSITDIHLSEKYLWDTKKRSFSDISFRFTKPGFGSFAFKSEFVVLFDKFILSISKT